MGRLRCAVVILIAVVLSTHALADRNARVRITLHEIPAAPEAKVELFLAWGARVKDPPAGWLKGHQEEFSGSRSSRSIETDTETIQIDPKVDSFILYGRVLSKDGTVLGYAPAKFHDISEEDSLTQLEVEATARKSFEEAFLDSYPLEYNRDQGYLESDNVRLEEAPIDFEKSVEALPSLIAQLDARLPGILDHQLERPEDGLRCLLRRVLERARRHRARQIGLRRSGTQCLHPRSTQASVR